MSNDEGAVWLAAGLRTPFVGVDGPFAHRDSLALSVPVVQAMAPQVTGPIDFAVWGSVVLNLAYANLAREVWLESNQRPSFGGLGRHIQLAGQELFHQLVKNNATQRTALDRCCRFDWLLPRDRGRGLELNKVAVAVAGNHAQRRRT